MARLPVQLSSEAQSVMLQCFREGLPASLVALRIKAETGEDVAERTVSRRKSEWEAEQLRRRRGREQMEDLLSAARAGDSTASEMVNALAVEALMRDPEGTLTVDPVELQKLSIAAERVRIQAKRLDLQARSIALDESKFELMKGREERALQVANELKGKAERGETLTAADINRVREIYGLND